MFRFKHSAGFTLVELVMVIVILGIISVVVTARFSDNSVFQAKGFNDQVLAALRYAQKSAIAQHQKVCVTLTASTLDLAIDSACATNLNLPDRNSHILTAPAGISLNPAMSLSFDALGRANTTVSITVSGVTSPIIVEAETGYVHQ